MDKFLDGSMREEESEHTAYLQIVNTWKGHTDSSQLIWNLDGMDTFLENDS